MKTMNYIKLLQEAELIDSGKIPYRLDKLTEKFYSVCNVNV